MVSGTAAVGGAPDGRKGLRGVQDVAQWVAHSFSLLRCPDTAAAAAHVAASQDDGSEGALGAPEVDVEGVLKERVVTADAQAGGAGQSAADVAACFGVCVEQVAKVLAYVVGSEYVALVASGSSRISSAKLGSPPPPVSPRLPPSPPFPSFLRPPTLPCQSQHTPTRKSTADAVRAGVSGTASDAHLSRCHGVNGDVCGMSRGKASGLRCPKHLSVCKLHQT